MQKKIIMALFTAVLLIFSAQVPVSAGDLVRKEDYQMNEKDTLPAVLNIGYNLDCGPLTIRLAAQPILTKSSLSIVADQDLKFLVLRLCITNNSDEPVGWFHTDSFTVRETYMGRYYGTYPMDAIMSAKIAGGYQLPAFYTPIEPGKMIQTIIVFDVFPDVQSWVVTFRPRVFGEEEAKDSVMFQLPNVLVQ